MVPGRCGGPGLPDFPKQNIFLIDGHQELVQPMALRVLDLEIKKVLQLGKDGLWVIHQEIYFV